MVFFNFFNTYLSYYNDWETNISANNVFGWEKNSPVVYRISEQPGNIKRINLLMIREDETYKKKETVKFHYIWINTYLDFCTIKINIKNEYTSANLVCMVIAEKTCWQAYCRM